MIIQTIHKNKFCLQDTEGKEIAFLIYRSTDFSEATLIATEVYSLHRSTTGVWQATIKKNNKEKVVVIIKVEPGGIISVHNQQSRKRFYFKRSVNWKPRFALINKDGDELLALLPSVNWEKESHDYTLQLNEEYEKDCDSFLILQAVHCANLCMSMMTGGKVPALISV